MRFVLPYHADMRFEATRRRQILKGTTSLQLHGTPEGAPLEDRFEEAFEYSDCWIEYSRLVALNARDAAARGARINVRTMVISAEAIDGHWKVTLEEKDDGATRVVEARMLVNAGGPWVEDVIHNKVHVTSTEGGAVGGRQPYRDAQTVRSRQMLFHSGGRRADHFHNTL